MQYNGNAEGGPSFVNTGMIPPSDAQKKPQQQPIPRHTASVAAQPGAQPFQSNWLPLNPLEHELDSYCNMAPSYRHLTNRESRSNSFNASSATSYVRRKDVDQFLANSISMGAPPEVSFSTPQAYTFEPEGLLVPEPLDLETPYSGNDMSVGINPQLLSQAGAQPGAHPGSVTVNTPGSGHTPGSVAGSVPTPGSYASARSVLPNDSNYWGTDLNSPQVAESMSYTTPMMAVPGVGSYDSPMAFPSYHSASSHGGRFARDPLVPGMMDRPHEPVVDSQEIFDKFISIGGDDATKGSEEIKQEPMNDASVPLDFSEFTSTDFGSVDGAEVKRALEKQYDSNPTQYLKDLNGDAFWNRRQSNSQQQATHRSSFSSTDSQNKLPQHRASISLGHPHAMPTAQSFSPQTSPTALASTESATPTGPILPSSDQVRRYVRAYHKFFNPHLHFIHSSTKLSSQNMALVMVMAAIGALYLGDIEASLRIHDMGRDCTRMYSDINSDITVCGTSSGDPNGGMVPLWLVQASVLSVVYGLFHKNSEDNEMAIHQGQRLGKLTRRAGLHMPLATPPNIYDPQTPVQEKWAHFLRAQKRIRTMYAVHAVTTMMTTMYGLPPFASNQDLQCGSPCDEALWNAQNAEDWWQLVVQRELQTKFLGGSNFGHCFAVLLSEQPVMERVSQTLLLTLMYSIHLEIAQRRAKHSLMRHSESMLQGDGFSWADATPHLHSQHQQDPSQQPYFSDGVVRAWESTWSRSPLASLDPNSKHGPIMSECVPLASLAYIRIHVDLITVKERFWVRDFVGMNNELNNLRATSFPGLLASANYAVDTVSLAEKYTLGGTQLFVHTIMCMVDCAFVLSETLYEISHHSHPLPDQEQRIVTRATKVFSRLVDDPSEPLHISALRGISKVLGRGKVWPYVDVIQEALDTRINNLLSL